MLKINLIVISRIYCEKMGLSRIHIMVYLVNSCVNNDIYNSIKLIAVYINDTYNNIKLSAVNVEDTFNSIKWIAVYVKYTCNYI